VGRVDLPYPPTGLFQRLHPAVGRLHPRHGLRDQGIGDGDHQVVLAAEVAVDGGGIGAQRAAELRQAEARHTRGIEQLQRLGDDQLAGEDAALEPLPMSIVAVRRHLRLRS
jgi:hypothetical protein